MKEFFFNDYEFDCFSPPSFISFFNEYLLGNEKISNTEKAIIKIKKRGSKVEFILFLKKGKILKIKRNLLKLYSEEIQRVTTFYFKKNNIICFSREIGAKTDQFSIHDNEGKLHHNECPALYKREPMKAFHYFNHGKELTKKEFENQKNKRDLFKKI